MIRVTIELLPGGNEARRRTIGLMEISNDGVVTLEGKSDYTVHLKKTPPFDGALVKDWKRGKFEDDEETAIGRVEGFHRTKRGVYDLIFHGLKACGLNLRSPGGGWSRP